MNVHVSCTPEFSIDKLDEVVNLLKSIPGEFKFIKQNPLNTNLLRRLNNRYESIGNISSLRFDDFFELVEYHREVKEIHSDDFLIVISSIRNDRKWFSAFKKRNIFIHGEEWDLVSDVDSKFALAYECVENVFQSLIDLKTYEYHEVSIGCINDLCIKKNDIQLKLQSATICAPCYRRAIEMGLTTSVLAHLSAIMEVIRKEFVFSRNFVEQTDLDVLRVSEKGKIFIGDKEIKMNLLPRVMYIGFLQKSDGVLSAKKCESKEFFEEVYKKVKDKNRDEHAIEKMLCNRAQLGNRVVQKITFETYRTRVKQALERELGSTLANFYAINLVENSNGDSLFKVNIPTEKIEIPTRFK
jgi:hypothetical protein